MNIVYVNPTLLMRRPIAALANHFCRKYRVSIFMPIRKKIDNSWHFSKVNKKVKVITYDTISPPIQSDFPIPKQLNYFKKIHKILKENDIIHIYVPYYITTVLVLILAKIYGKKVILTMDTIPGFSFKMSKKFNLMDFAFKIYGKCFGWLIFNLADVIHHYSKTLIPFSKQVHINQKKVKIISTGINLKDFNCKSDINIRNKYKIPKNKKIVLFAGILNERKGSDILYEVILLLKDLPIHFLILGEGKDKKKFENLPNVTTVGWVKNIHTYYKQCDLFFFPTRGEGLAGVLMEAMASGLPIVTSKIPSNIDLLRGRGILKDLDPYIFAKEIRNILFYKKKRYRQIKIKTREYIRNKDWSLIFPKYERLYKHVWNSRND